ncbi:ATP-binding protein [Sphingomonas nostoxanthinifaciens]|uniref:ATP-binding protein n=1 Tax=Sphingomonas nostoxanthinifaciens TaxID=2872652 RepID=UPI001CC1CFFA|nr:ATP-binding protein [Sphingomonas nostoxanthinifaciens]UAK25282.1 PAS domain-containing protein [Sphingomonas nostoxanthinifaciens]
MADGETNMGGIGPLIAKTQMGQAIRATDWAVHPLGSPATWPISLKTILTMMAACPTPMFLAWGDDLSVFFNDAYRPIWGSLLREGLTGARFRDVWGHIWDDIGPLVDAALAGESITMTNMKLDMQREGVSEESWWTFTYSPVTDDENRIVGMICVTRETTGTFVAERERISADEGLQVALSAGTTIGSWEWDPITDRVTADERFAQLYGISTATTAAGAAFKDFFANVHPSDRERVATALTHARRTGEVFREEYRILERSGSVRWVASQGQCINDKDGRCVRFPGVSYDVTERVEAVHAAEAGRDERDFIVALTARQRELETPDTILRLSVQSLGQRLGADRCGFYRLLSNDRVRYGPCWTNGMLDPITGEHDALRFGERIRRSRDTGEILTFADSEGDLWGGLELLAEVGTRSGICLPVKAGGRYSAGFFLHGAEVRHWTQADVTLFKEVAELTMQAVERAEATIRLQTRVGQQEDALVTQAGELRDETASRNAAENQVRQLQKMEAVGQLTGGIAHDFNNMLAIIIGGLNLMQRRIARGETDVARYVDAAMDGATRAAALTQRLLAFSRQQPLAPEPLDVNRMVGGLTDLLDRTLGERVRLETVLGAGVWRVKADPSELENVIVNLAVNARDAMPEGGELTIDTSNAHIDDDYALEEGLKPGQFVLIAVSDTGSGMPAEVMAKAFDPFFTTKGVGKGTGLGLSQVFGFVRQSGGHVKIYSEEGHGTTVKIYLPRLYGEAPALGQARRRVAQPKGGSPTEVIMVVEDEDRLRNFTVEALRELGYTVVHAADGDEALRMIGAGQGATLLFTDIVMPGMTGRQLADIAIERIAGLKVLYTTGYTRNAIVHNGTLDAGTNFLAKPYGIDDLAAKVREVLDAA